MALDPGVVALVLLAAAFHATWNAMVKAGGDRLVVQALVIATPGVAALPLLAFVAPPDPASWPYLFASLVIHCGYYASLLYAYHHGDLSQVYPIARGSTPLLVAVGGWLLAGESLTALELAGIVVLSGGIISLAWRRGLPRDGETWAVVFALLTSLTIGAYSLADGLGVRRAGSELGYILWLFAIEGPPLLLVALWQRRRRLSAAFLPYLKVGLAGGIVSGLAYGIVIWCWSLGPMAHISALRETSVVMAAAIGALVLKERFGRFRITAAAVVAAGAALLNVGG